MRRIILIFAAIALSLSAAEAQQDERYSQGVFTETTTVTHHKIDKPKKERTLHETKSGYQQHTSLSWWWTPETDHSALRLSYIGGYRFGNYFFAGAGAGIDVGILNTYILDWHGDYYVPGGDVLPMQSIAIPLFANIKCYFTKRGVSPYLSFSAGARFSTFKKVKRYDTNGRHIQTFKHSAVDPFFELAAGINCRISDNNSITLQLGSYTHRVFYMYDFSDCIEVVWRHGLACSIGLTF